MHESNRIGAQGGMETSFGFQSVDETQKQAKVDAVFHSVAQKYDLMNDIMSLGLHRAWKKAMVAALKPRPSWQILDVAGGTGDIAFRLVQASQRHNNCAHVTVADINSSMLDVGRARAQQKNYAHKLDFIEANAENLPFNDNHFDAYTIAFGIRNVPHIDRALAQAYRVLKPGAQFLCLEFSKLDLPFLEKIYDLWSFQAIPRFGQMLTNDADSYRYLVESIRKFPAQEDFATMIKQAGFHKVSYRNFSGGICALHSAWKI